MTKEVRANQVSIAQLLQEKPLDSTEIIPKYVEGRIKLCKGQKQSFLKAHGLCDRKL